MSFFANFATLEIGEKHKSTPLDIWHPAMKVAFLRGRDFHIPFRLWKFRNLVCRFKNFTVSCLDRFMFESQNLLLNLSVARLFELTNAISETSQAKMNVKKTALWLLWAFLLKGQRFSTDTLWHQVILVCKTTIQWVFSRISLLWKYVKNTNQLPWISDTPPWKLLF